MLQAILNSYGLKKDETEILPFGNGLINHTWTVHSGAGKFILQRINHSIFKSPNDIAENIRLIGSYLEEHYAGYLFVTATKTLERQEIVHLPEEGYFRMFPFVKGSHTIDVVTTPLQAYEAAKQFGRFTTLLSGFPVEKLNITLPDFHNLPLRYQHFELAVSQGNKDRIREAAAIINFLTSHVEIVTISKGISSNKEFKQRVTHHDTKISNVLFDDDDKGLCVIDLDTVMPGYFISDVGDMMRTYLSPVSEEEKDFTTIKIRDEYFKAIADGYLSEMNKELTSFEKKHFVYAGKFMIYMQALRFLTDYLNDDVYYGSKYKGHNFVRANNQATLLKRLIEKENELSKLI